MLMGSSAVVRRTIIFGNTIRQLLIFFYITEQFKLKKKILFRQTLSIVDSYWLIVTFFFYLYEIPVFSPFHLLHYNFMIGF